MNITAALQKLQNITNPPSLFENGTGNIWTEPYLAKQMLEAHLNQNIDAASRTPDKINKAVDFINANIKAKSKILDLGCGPGLYAERFCQSGHDVTGLDFSENTIEYDKKSANQKGLKIDYVCKSFFDMDFCEQFDVVLQIYAEMNTFSDSERDKILSLIYKSLKDGGVFIFDLFTPEKKSENEKTYPCSTYKDWYYQNGGFWREKEALVLQENFSYKDNIRLEQFFVVDEDDITIYRNWFHDYTKETIIAVLEKIGFSKVRVIQNLYDNREDANSKFITVFAYK